MGSLNYSSFNLPSVTQANTSSKQMDNVNLENHTIAKKALNIKHQNFTHTQN